MGRFKRGADLEHNLFSKSAIIRIFLNFFFVEEYACRGTLFVKKVSTSHSAYVATNTKSNGAKIDGF